MAAGSAAILSLGLLASGCAGPTYGTDKTATEQLLDDLGSIASIKPQKGAEIAYSPRPAIVKPPETGTLPEPQKPVAENNPAWVEPPEKTRERLKAEASENENDPGYRSPLAVASASGGTSTRVGVSPAAAEGSPSPLAVMRGDQNNRQFKENLKIQQGAYSDRRRYLSDPPLEYRKPAETAPVGELGESEREKEQRRIAAATKAKKTKWFQWPW